MTNASLEKHIKSYYQENALPEETLARLQSLADETNAPIVQSPQRRVVRLKSFYWILGAAAMLLVLIASAVYRLSGSAEKKDQLGQLRVAIAEEIAHGHMKNKPVRFSATHYQDLNTQMTKLGFETFEPRRLADKPLSLKGARYCSLDGNIAAQIKLENNAGVICTLYMATLTDKLKSLGEYTMHFDGLEVRVWHENNLVMGLAVPLNESPPAVATVSLSFDLDNL